MFSLTTRRLLLDPLAHPWALHRRISRMLDDAFTAFPSGDQSVVPAWVPAVDVFEDQESVRIVAEVPGVRRDEVKISLEQNLLTIRGEKKQLAEEETERAHRFERRYGAFERTFTLPASVDADRIQARYENGVLTVTLPKSERARPREIPVETS